MESQELIIIDVFCKECDVELTLIEDLDDFGLIEIVQNNGVKYIHSHQLPHVQKVIHFHNELNINKEGIEIVLHLLERLKQQNQALKLLQDKLKIYE